MDASDASELVGELALCSRYRLHVKAAVGYDLASRHVLLVFVMNYNVKLPSRRRFGRVLQQRMIANIGRGG